MVQCLSEILLQYRIDLRKFVGVEKAIIFVIWRNMKYNMIKLLAFLPVPYHNKLILTKEGM